MDIIKTDDDIKLVLDDAKAYQVKDDATFQGAKENSQVCSRMRIEINKFADALQQAQKLYDSKADAYYRAKPKSAPAKQEPAAPSLSLDDFDADPPDEADELTAELVKNSRLF